MAAAVRSAAEYRPSGGDGADARRAGFRPAAVHAGQLPAPARSDVPENPVGIPVAGLHEHAGVPAGGLSVRLPDRPGQRQDEALAAPAGHHPVLDELAYPYLCAHPDPQGQRAHQHAAGVARDYGTARVLHVRRFRGVYGHPVHVPAVHGFAVVRIHRKAGQPPARRGPGSRGQRLPVVLARYVPADPARHHRGLDARFPAVARGVLHPRNPRRGQEYAHRQLHQEPVHGGPRLAARRGGEHHSDVAAGPAHRGVPDGQPQGRLARPYGRGGVMMRKLGKLWLWIVYAFLFLPIFVVIVYSFNAAKYTSAWKGFTLKWYSQLFGNAALIDAVVNTLSVAALAASLATLLGVLAALCLKRTEFPGRQLLHASLYVLTVSPEMVMGISLLIFFISVKLPLGFVSMLIAHTTLGLPFVALTVLARLAEFDEHLVEAARDLGATEAQAFRYVILPVIMPAVVAGWLLAFTLSMDDVLISFFVAGPTFEVLPLRIYSMVRLGVKPDINALSAIMFCVTIALVMLAFCLSRPRKSLRKQG